MTYEIRGPYLRPEPHPVDGPQRADRRPYVALALFVLALVLIVTAHPTDGFGQNMVAVISLVAAIAVAIRICERPHQ